MNLGRINSDSNRFLTSLPDGAPKTDQPSANLFDKYVVNSAEELEELNNKGLLKGALVITGDRKHVGIHKVFWVAQKIRAFFESIRGLFQPKRQINTDLCHGMVVVGWNKKWDEEKQFLKSRPLLAHSVMDGVKLNAVDYFNYADKDVDHMFVYVPKDQALREEFARNAEKSSTISSQKENRSKFSWGNLLTCMFKTQVRNRPSKAMQKHLAYTVTDLLMERKLSEPSNHKKARPFYCIEYAIEMLQASVLTKALSPEAKKDLLYSATGALLSRDEVAKKIYASLKSQDVKSDPLAKAYWENRICSKISANGILSSYAALVFDKISDQKSVPMETLVAKEVTPAKKKPTLIYEYPTPMIEALNTRTPLKMTPLATQVPIAVGAY